jgi:hypothetical protein
MMFMNTFDIDAAQRLAVSALQIKAANFLAAFRDQVNENSDGWAHWKAPVAAAEKLMFLVQNPGTNTESSFKAAMTPIKAFYTRRGFAAGMKFPVVY